jgi:hypothetical protein
MSASRTNVTKLRGNGHMLRNLIFAAVLGAAAFIATISPSSPSLAQTCQQNCQQQHPVTAGDRFAYRAREQCIRACNRKK